jgi:sortase A
LKHLRIYGLISAIVLVALGTLLILPVIQDARSEPRPTEAVPAKGTNPTLEKAPKPSTKASKETRQSAYEKLALNKLDIEEPAPTPQPEREPQKEPEHRVKAGAANVSVLPGPARKAPTPKAPTPKAPAPKAPARKAPVQKVPEQKVPESRPPADIAKLKPRDNRLLLSVPRLGLVDVTIGDSPDQAYLDREGIMHLSETGFPYERGSNTYIVGHAADYATSRVPNVFRNLKSLQQGDLITLRDTLGRTYNYRAYQYLIVSPKDVWVTDPLPGQDIVSLQTCYPDPTFNKRLIIRAERVK